MVGGPASMSPSSFGSKSLRGLKAHWKNTRKRSLFHLHIPLIPKGYQIKGNGILVRKYYGQERVTVVDASTRVGWKSFQPKAEHYMGSAQGNKCKRSVTITTALYPWTQTYNPYIICLRYTHIWVSILFFIPFSTCVSDNHTNLVSLVPPALLITILTLCASTLLSLFFTKAMRAYKNNLGQRSASRHLRVPSRK